MCNSRSATTQRGNSSESNYDNVTKRPAAPHGVSLVPIRPRPPKHSVPGKEWGAAENLELRRICNLLQNGKEGFSSTDGWRQMAVI
jgi:hypothetical protein